MNLATWGVWLIGIGALTIAVGLVVGSERPYEGMTFRGPFSTTGDRLRFAVEGSGAALVATGSVLLAIAEAPSVGLLVVIPCAYAVGHVLAAWKQHQYRQYRLDEATQAAGGEAPGDPRMFECAKTCSSWAWCLRHPLTDEYWPGLSTAD